MRHTLITTTIALSAVVGLSSCGFIAHEATQELAFEVRDEVALRTRDGGRTDDYDVLSAALAVVLDDEQDEDPDWRPRVVGLEDADADGFDDDGRVEIIVRTAESCLLVDGLHVDVADSPC